MTDTTHVDMLPVVVAAWEMVRKELAEQCPALLEYDWQYDARGQSFPVFTFVAFGFKFELLHREPYPLGKGWTAYIDKNSVSLRDLDLSKAVEEGTQSFRDYMQMKVGWLKTDQHELEEALSDLTTAPTE